MAMNDSEKASITGSHATGDKSGGNHNSPGADSTNETINESMSDSMSDSMNNDQFAPLANKLLWVDTRSGVNRLIIGLVVLCVFLFAMDFIWHRHVKVPGEELYGFHAIAGFVSFTVIVLGARALRYIIKRDESFYAPYGVDAEDYPQAGTQQLEHQHWQGDSVASLGKQIMGATVGQSADTPDNETQENKSLSRGEGS